MKRSRSTRTVRPAASQAVTPLEQRRLLSAAVSTALPAQTVTVGNSTPALSLGSYFTDTAVPAGDTVVLINTNLPAPNNVIPLALTASATPQTVAAFVSYINNGEYANTIVHRSVPGFVIQGGGYTASNPATHIASLGNIPGEYHAINPAALTNTTGTIAIALSNGPNSGTSEWFINLGDNTVLDTGDGGPFTAFGQVIYNGLATANAIAALPIVNDTVNGALNTVPVLNNFAANGATVASVPAADLVTLNPVVAADDGLTYSVTSSDPGLVAAGVTDGSLSLTPVAGATGTSNITVTATDLGGGTVTSTFPYTIDPLTTTPTPTPTTTGTVSGIVTNDGAGVAGRTVFLDANANAVLDAGEPTATTDATGAFVFADVPVGSYQVRDVVPTGYTQATPAAGYVSTTVTAGGAVTALAFATTTNTGLTPTVAKSTVPTSAISGSKVKGAVTVSVTNTTAAADKGVNTLRLYAVPSGVTDPTAGTLLSTVKRKLNLKASGTTKLTLPVKPTALPSGTYSLVTVTTDASSNVVPTVTGSPTLTVADPVVTLTGAAGAVSPTALVAGKTISFSVTVSNTGNVNSTGPLTAVIGLTTNSTTVAVPLTTVNRRATVKANGKAVVLKFRVKIPAGTPAGTYFPLVSITQGTATATAVGTVPFTIGTVVA